MRIIALATALLVLAVIAPAQQSTPDQNAPSQHPPKAEEKPPALSKPNEKPQTPPTPARPLTRAKNLATATTAYVKYGGGNRIPYDAIESALEGWAHYTLVETPEKADIIIEISAPEEGGVSVSSSTSISGGRPDESTRTTRSISASQVRMSVYDQKTKLPLWSGTEQPKFAMKRNAKENNLLAAAQKLFERFRDRVEPPVPQ
jgi:hypothetical protein